MQTKYVALAVMGALVLGSAQARAEGKDGVAAVVNGEKITVAELRDAYNANKDIKAKYSFEDFYGKAVEVFVNGKLVYQAAKAEGIENSPEYKKQLNIAKEELARKIYLEQQVEKKISDAEVKKVYNEYKNSFKTEKEVSAKHILADSDAKAKEVIAKLNNGENFDKLAKEYSREPAELGYFTKDVMVPEFGKAAFALKKGEYTKAPVKTQFGYHVILVEDVRDAKPLSYEKAKPQLKAMMTQGALSQIFNDVNQKGKITRYDLKGNVMEPDKDAQAALSK